MVAAVTHWAAMGGYAEYVWPAYAIAVVVLGGLVVHSWRWHRNSRAALEQLERRTGRRVGRRG
jgi:heme exporter protein D